MILKISLKKNKMSNQVYDVSLPVGAHTAFSGQICDTLWTSINYGMYTTQFFMGNPQSFNRAKISFSDIEECRKILSRFNLNVFSHFPYIANLAGSVSSLAWQGDKTTDDKTEKLLQTIQYELSVLSNFKTNGVVIHPGSFKDREKGLQAIATSINKIQFTPNSKLILENSAGQGTSLATTFTEIKTIIDLVDEDKRKHIGVCIDTCHIFAYGEYNIRETAEMERMFNEFEQIIGKEHLSLIHLNDSEEKFKSRKDRHACLGDGYIWRDDFSSLEFLLGKIKQDNIPTVLETHGIDMLTIGVLSNKLGFSTD
jgi:apurinic endonuclease APN1